MTAPGNEMTHRTDPATGVSYRQLTDYRGHSHHLYFTNSGLLPDGQLLIASHRNNAANYFRVDLESGDLRQVTDFNPAEDPDLLTGFVNPRRDEAYLFCSGQLLAVSTSDGRRRVLCEVPPGYVSGNLSCTADGQTVCFIEREDLSDRIDADLRKGYVGFVETFEARPHCRIRAVDVESTEIRTLHEDDRWIGHCNTSPTDPDTLTFCHEGPWTRLQRLWALTISTGQARQLRPQTPPDEAIGHEYWFADGSRVGYHGWLNPETHLYGHVAPDGTDRQEQPWHGRSMHFHSIDETLIVGDGFREKPWLHLWALRDGGYVGPKALIHHRCSFHVQLLHVHPRMFAGPEGRPTIIYTSDRDGYGNVYLVEIPEFESLPEMDAV